MAELGAYVALWDEPGATYKRLAEKFKDNPGVTPSEMVPLGVIDKYRNLAMEIVLKEAFPACAVSGIFVARRVPQTVDVSNIDISALLEQVVQAKPKKK